MKTPTPPKLLKAATVLTGLLLASASLPAATFTWTGTTHNWDMASRWVGGALPTVDADIVFNTTLSDRVATFRNNSTLTTSMQNQINSLSISQTSDADNVVEMWRTLTVDEAITLQASGGGQSIIRLYTSTASNSPATGHVSTSGPVLIVPSVTLNSGGVLELAKIRASGSQSSTTQVQGNVVVAGGTLSVQRATRLNDTITTTGFTHVISGNLTMTSGLIEIGAAPTYNTDLGIANSGLQVTGDLSLSGESLTSIRASLVTHPAKIKAAAVTYGGDLSVTIDSPVSDAQTYSLFEFTSQGGDFSSVVLTGLYETSLTGSAGVWTGDTGGFTFTFTNATGLLTVVTSSIPEPSTAAALAGISVLLLAASLRRSRR